MNAVLGHRVTKQIALRLAADSVMVAATFFAGIVLRFFWVVVLQENEIPVGMLLVNFLNIYLSTVPMLILVSLFVFASSGFYTRGRSYTGKYKIAVVFEAVTLSYLGFGFLSY